MTEENMKKLYNHYVETGNTVEAEKISNIPRYSKFKEISKEKEPEKTKYKKVK